jgi:hypothetical protein
VVIGEHIVGCIERSSPTVFPHMMYLCANCRSKVFMPMDVHFDTAECGKCGAIIDGKSAIDPLAEEAASPSLQRETFSIDRTPYPRVRYGAEESDWGASRQPCSSCGVEAGHFHQIGCFVERCPKCKGQAMSCRCDYRETFVRHPMSNARRAFYKCFFLTIVPFGVASLVSLFLPIAVGVRLLLMVGIPLLLTLLFWRRIGELELNEVIVSNKNPSG